MIDLGEYKRKPARVFVNYEGWAPDAIDAALRERKKITLPDAYVRRECGCLKRLFVDAYNANRAREGRAPDALLDPDECQLAVKDSSYLTFSKEPVADWEIIGDALSDSQEVWVVSRRDMEMQDVEVRRMAKVVDDAEQEVRDHMSALDYVAMTTKSREVDPREPHALLVGMGLMHLLPVRPEWTVADIKCVFARAPRSARRRAREGSGRRAARREDGNDDALNRARCAPRRYFIHVKGGVDAFPLGSLDVALLQGNDLNVCAESDTMEALARRRFGPAATLARDGAKQPLPLCWGKRLQDPKYQMWMPTAHVPESFQGPQDKPAERQPGAPQGGPEGCTVS